MSREGFPDLGPEYTGFLHRHPPRPGYPEMKRHVVVDLEDWLLARQSAAMDAVMLWQEYVKYGKCNCQGDEGTCYYCRAKRVIMQPVMPQAGSSRPKESL